MQSEATKILVAVRDRRILANPAEAFGDYWRTCAMAAFWGALYFLRVEHGKSGVFWLFFGMLMIALSAARDGKREMQRKLDALVRRLEDKDAL